MKKETLKNTTDRRTYTILQKRETQYCFICCKRCGSFYGYCGPGTWKDRNRSNWKQKRKKQYIQT